MSDDGGTIGRILSGSSIIFVGVILNKAISFVASVFMARILGDTGYGVVALVLVFYFVGTTILNLGLNTGIARNYPQASSDAERRGILVSGFRMAAAVSAAVAALLFLWADLVAGVLFDAPGIAPVIRIVALAIPINVLAKLAQGTIQAIKRPTAKALIQSIINPIVRFGGILLFVLLGYDAAGVAGAYLLATFVTLVLSLYVVVRHTDLLAFNAPADTNYRSLLSFSLPLMGSTVLFTLMRNADTFLLGTYKTADVVGQYNVAYTLGMITLLFYTSLGFMYIPELSELFDDGRLQRAGQIYRSLTKWTFVISLPFVLVALLFPEFIITFIYSDTYTRAPGPFVILIGGFLTHLLAGHNNNTLTAFGDTRVIFLVDAGTLFVNIVLNVLLIPELGAVGAAVATSSAYVIRNVGLSAYLYRTYAFFPFGSALLSVSAPVCLVAAVVWLATESGSLLLVVAATGVLTLVTVVSYAAFGVEPDDVLVTEMIEDRTSLNLDPLRRLHHRLR